MDGTAGKQTRTAFDPFTNGLFSGKGSKSWFWATGVQALCTCALLGLAMYAEGRPWEHHVRLIVVIGIVGTWSLALRTIRERLLELMRYWHKASHGLLRKASESGLHLVAVPVSDAQERYVKGCIWRLRLIAAGITIPFFVMPLLWSVVSLALAFTVGPLAQDYWEGVALFTMASALIVAGYLHWVILPLPVPVRVTGAQRPTFRSRVRRR
ncbi:MAG: hypothetical protein NTW87_27725 [Planctomycetota bacterium]|nr:hypothetical protein [Planctomycetota bacterium]